tara:strand:- start:1160 stop:2227 length:1068 start_codon:yes stop_codon:yes gene_type:complete
MRLNHNLYFRLAFDLAEKNLGKTKNNPSVGCVIVRNGSVISSGVTSEKGNFHAEFNALNRKINFKESTMYVTLEPCTHYGQTPPCTNIIRHKKIKKVFYIFNDPDERTNQKAKKILKKKIEKLNKFEKKHKDFYKSYYLNKEKKIPLINAKIAISKDFFTISKKSKWITNDKSREVGHLIRSKYDCIVSTSHSINKDNSLLNCRIDGLNNNKPDLVIIDRNLRIKKKLKLYSLVDQRKTYIFTTSNNRDKINYLKKKKIIVIKIPNLKTKNDFDTLFQKLFEIGKRRVLVETGLVFLSKLNNFKLINELYLFKSNNFLHKEGCNNINKNFLKRLKFRNRINVNLLNDELFKIKIK